MYSYSYSLHTEIEIKLRNNAKKIRIVKSLTGNADLLFPTSASTLAVRYYDGQSLARLENDCKIECEGDGEGEGGGEGSGSGGEKGDGSSSGKKGVKASFLKAMTAHTDTDKDTEKESDTDMDVNNTGEKYMNMWDYNFDNVRTFRDAFKHTAVFIILSPGGSSCSSNTGNGTGNGNGSNAGNGSGGGSAAKVKKINAHNQLNTVDSVVNMLQTSLSYFPNDHDHYHNHNKHNNTNTSSKTKTKTKTKTTGCARVFLVPDCASVLETIAAIQESLSPSKVQKKELYFQKESERLLFLEDGHDDDNDDEREHARDSSSPSLSLSSRAAGMLSMAAFRCWAESEGISVADANVVLSVMGSLENVIKGAMDEMTTSSSGGGGGFDRVPVESHVKKSIIEFFGGSVDLDLGLDGVVGGKHEYGEDHGIGNDDDGEYHENDSGNGRGGNTNRVNMAYQNCEIDTGFDNTSGFNFNYTEAARTDMNGNSNENVAQDLTHDNHNHNHPSMDMDIGMESRDRNFSAGTGAGPLRRPLTRGRNSGRGHPQDGTFVMETGNGDSAPGQSMYDASPFEGRAKQFSGGAGVEHHYSQGQGQRQGGLDSFHSFEQISQNPFHMGGSSMNTSMNMNGNMNTLVVNRSNPYTPRQQRSYQTSSPPFQQREMRHDVDYSLSQPTPHSQFHSYSHSGVHTGTPKQIIHAGGIYMQNGGNNYAHHHNMNAGMNTGTALTQTPRMSQSQAPYMQQSSTRSVRQRTSQRRLLGNSLSQGNNPNPNPYIEYDYSGGY